MYMPLGILASDHLRPLAGHRLLSPSVPETQIGRRRPWERHQQSWPCRIELPVSDSWAAASGSWLPSVAIGTLVIKMESPNAVGVCSGLCNWSCPFQTTRLISLLACESEPIARPDVRRFVSFFPSRFIRQSSPRRQGNNFEGPRCAAASPVAPPRCFTRDEELADTGDRILGRTVDAVYSRDRSAPARPTGHQSPAVVGRLDGAVYLCESHNRPSRNAAAEERERRRLTSLGRAAGMGSRKQCLWHQVYVKSRQACSIYLPR